MMIPILVTDVMEAVSLVPEETIMIVKNHAQTTFIGTMDIVSILAQKVTMKMMQQSKLVNHAT
jgi:general stress protein CsbA